MITLRRGLVHRFDGGSFHLVDLDFGGALLEASSRSGAWWKARHPAPWFSFSRSTTTRRISLPSSQTRAVTLARRAHRGTRQPDAMAPRDGARFSGLAQAMAMPTFDTGDTFDSTLVFTEDSHGGVWIGVVDGGVARFHDERFVWMRESVRCARSAT